MKQFIPILFLVLIFALSCSDDDTTVIRPEVQQFEHCDRHHPKGHGREWCVSAWKCQGIIDEWKAVADSLEAELADCRND